MLSEMFPYLSALLIEEVARKPDRVVFRTRVRASAAVCQCGEGSARVHGRYVRQLCDVAAGGLGVVIELCVRRFRCENARCPAVTFVDRELGANYFAQRDPARAMRRMTKEANSLGLTIRFDPIPA
ncbi:hypothetical protein CTZ27_35390 [Streptomyces griseocarneus]|nr:hypothetical protein CTZ27_35390 [Streptomyces griseocarneus]